MSSSIGHQTVRYSWLSFVPVQNILCKMMHVWWINMSSNRHQTVSTAEKDTIFTQYLTKWCMFDEQAVSSNGHQTVRCSLMSFVPVLSYTILCKMMHVWLTNVLSNRHHTVSTAGWWEHHIFNMMHFWWTKMSSNGHQTNC